MSVLIKGMEMPENCMVCEMWHNIDCHPYQGISPPKSRPNHCPLVPVPPHGRLIDAGELFEAIVAKYIRREQDDFVMKLKQDMADVINALPTIIEAEEGE